MTEMRAPNSFLNWHRPAKWYKCTPKELGISPVYASPQGGKYVGVEFRAADGTRIEFTLSPEDAALLHDHIADALGSVGYRG